MVVSTSYRTIMLGAKLGHLKIFIPLLRVLVLWAQCWSDPYCGKDRFAYSTTNVLQLALCAGQL